MTWRLLREKLPPVCMVVLSLVNLLLLLQIRPPDRLVVLRSTTRLDRNGWDPSLALTTAPLGEPMRSRAQPLAQTPVLWTAPQTPRRRRLCSPSWGPSPSNADDVPYLGAMISWWQRKHDARYGPSEGAEHVCPRPAPAVPECLAGAQEADPALDLHAMD